jgi:hypothetical protein
MPIVGWPQRSWFWDDADGLPSRLVWDPSESRTPRESLGRLVLTLLDAALVIDREAAVKVFGELSGGLDVVIPSKLSTASLRGAVSRMREIIRVNRLGRHTKGVFGRCPGCRSRDDDPCFCERPDTSVTLQPDRVV